MRVAEAPTSRQATLVLAITKTHGGAEECLRVVLDRLIAAAPSREAVLVHEHARTRDLPAHRRWQADSRVGDLLAAVGSLGRLALRAARLRPAMTIANGFRSTLVLALLRPLVGGARVVYVHDARRRALDLVLRWIRPSLVLVPASGLVPRYASRYRTIAIQGFAAPSDARPRRRVAGEALRVACIANVVRLKGLEHGVAAVANAVARGARMTLRIHGEVVDTDYAREVDAAIERLGMGDAIRRLPFAAVDRILADADVLIVTTVSAHGGPETFGRTVLESFERGVPVVAFACGGPAAVIRDGIGGVLVGEGDDAALADALVELAERPALYERLSAGAIAERRRTQARLDSSLDRLVRTRLFSGIPKRGRR